MTTITRSFMILALLAAGARAATAATSYIYIPASACRPYNGNDGGDCVNCTRPSDLGTERAQISIPNSAADQSIVCDVTFPNSATNVTPTVEVLWHASSVDSAKNACFRARQVCVPAGSSPAYLNGTGDEATAFSTLTTTALTTTSLENRVSSMTLTARQASGSNADCTTSACKNRMCALFIQRRGSSNCSNSLTTTPVLIDQINYSYTQ